LAPEIRQRPFPIAASRSWSADFAGKSGTYLLVSLRRISIG